MDVPRIKYVIVKTWTLLGILINYLSVLMTLAFTSSSMNNKVVECKKRFNFSTNKKDGQPSSATYKDNSSNQSKAKSNDRITYQKLHKKIIDANNRKTPDNKTVSTAKINKEIRSFAEVTRKNCSGSNNWERFISKSAVVNEESCKVIKKVRHKQKIMKMTPVIAMDCEMVGTGEDGKDSILARVSLVNEWGTCVFDKFVKPSVKVTDYRTHVSGIRPIDLENAERFEIVKNDVSKLIRGRILVGHGLKNDLEVLNLSHPFRLTRDTSKYFRKKNMGTPSLKNLAFEYLGMKIQEGEHSSVQDAKAALSLYNLHKNQWESLEKRNKYSRINSNYELYNCVMTNPIDKYD